MGEGNPFSKLMLIGEAPGEREDDLDKPFQGKAGQLLDEVLESVGLDRSMVWIDNAVRCRPPDNRRPKEDEVKSCGKYLHRLVGVIQPLVLVALGATALWATTRRTGITQYCGKPFLSQRFRVLVVPTFHPAYVLRVPSARKILERDILLAKRLVQSPILHKEVE